jgi:hypothetical protein
MVICMLNELELFPHFESFFEKLSALGLLKYRARALEHKRLYRLQLSQSAVQTSATRLSDT